MQLDSCCAHSMGTLIVEGCHQPFRALACPLHLSAVTITPAHQTALRSHGRQSHKF